MKVLFVTNMYPVSSMEHYGIFVKEQIDQLQAHFGVVPRLYFINARDRGKWEYVKSMFKVRSLIKRHRIDAIHIHYGISGIFLFLTRPKVKVFLTLHGGDILRSQGFFLQNLLSRLIIRRVDKVFILNDEMRSVVDGMSVDFEMLPCGVNTGFFQPNAREGRGNVKCIIFPGDPTLSVKNFALFDQVFKILKKDSKFELEFKIINNLSRQGVRRILAAGDCLVMTSVSEGSPQIIKEALSCNLPVVSVRVGDVHQMLEGIPSCFISADRQPQTLARLVVDVLKNRSTNIRAAFLAKKIYDNQSVCKRLVENYAS